MPRPAAQPDLGAGGKVDRIGEHEGVDAVGQAS